MQTSLIQFLVSAAVIVAAGAALAQFGEIISHRTKMGGLLVGGLLIAGATSLPELAINVNVVRRGQIDMAVGGLMGSNLFNLLILAVFDLTKFSRGAMFSKPAAGNALAAAVSMLLAALAGAFIFLGPTIGDFSIARIGPGSVLIAGAYIVGFRLIFFSREKAEKKDVSEVASVIAPLRKMTLQPAIWGFLAAAAVILIAAPALAAAAEDLADETGLGGTFFGSVFVGISTSLPEVVTVYSAVRMQAFDMAVGNILGSNCFNMLLLAPLDLAIGASLLSAASPAHLYTAFCSVIVTGVVILGQLYQVERKTWFEPDAAMAIALVVAAFVGLYFVR